MTCHGKNIRLFPEIMVRPDDKTSHHGQKLLHLSFIIRVYDDVISRILFSISSLTYTTTYFSFVKFGS